MEKDSLSLGYARFIKIIQKGEKFILLKFSKAKDDFVKVGEFPSYDEAEYYAFNGRRKIKKCPFCGFENPVLDKGCNLVGIICPKCKIQFCFDTNNEEETINAWNRREGYYKSLYLAHE